MLVEIQKKHEELTKREENRAKVNEKLSSFFAVHLQKGITLVYSRVLQTSPRLKITVQDRCVLIAILQPAHGAFVCGYSTSDKHVMSLKVKCDHRSKFSNLSNWKEEA